MPDISDIQDQVRNAADSGTPLLIQGGNSKSFYGRQTSGEALSLHDYRGIIDYTPSELVISARAGTPLSDLESALENEGQMLGFEPPRFGDNATLGGTIACGLSGPRRPYTGAARDFVLGVNCINGKGELLRLGGQVMKNVAGYDLSRTLTGSLGTLAVLLDIHIKVLPRPESEVTLHQTCSADSAVQRFNQWAGQPLPLSAACHVDGQLYVRLSGMDQGVQAAATKIGGDQLDNGARFWQQLREHQLPFFAGEKPLWRLSVPADANTTEPAAESLLDWGGAQRWIRTDQQADTLRSIAGAAGGHATLFRGDDQRTDIFHPLQPSMLALHQRLKQSFDPAGILNPGRMYPDL
jgi:glycolate oxidase FAD binding subunit